MINDINFPFTSEQCGVPEDSLGGAEEKHQRYRKQSQHHQHEIHHSRITPTEPGQRKVGSKKSQHTVGTFFCDASITHIQTHIQRD